MTTEILMLIAGVLIAECTEIAPWLAKRLVRWSSHLRYADQVHAEIRAEELEAYIEERPGKLFKLTAALLFAIQAATALLCRSAGRIRSRRIVRQERALQKESATVVEGLLAYTSLGLKRPGRNIKIASQAVATSRALAEKNPDEYVPLLARCLISTAQLLLHRKRATEALPLAQEAVALTRPIGGAILVRSLGCLATALASFARYSEAAPALGEADEIPGPE